MNIRNLQQEVEKRPPITGLFYCAPGVGKSTALGIFAAQTKGRTLVLDVDRTFTNAMRKGEIDVDLSKIDIVEVENRSKQVDKDTKEVTVKGTFEAWTELLTELGKLAEAGKLDYDNICVDNISELERCILSDLGAQGKNKGVPAQADYQYMQFKLVNSLRYMKSWGKNIFWTAWETIEPFHNADGTSYSRRYPKISAKIVDNICGLCDVVGRIQVGKDGSRGIILDATANAYAKNQIDSRKACAVEKFVTKEG